MDFYFYFKQQMLVILTVVLRSDLCRGHGVSVWHVCTEHISIGTVAGYWFNNFRFITLQIHWHDQGTCNWAYSWAKWYGKEENIKHRQLQTVQREAGRRELFCCNTDVIQNLVSFTFYDLWLNANWEKSSLCFCVHLYGWL